MAPTLAVNVKVWEHGLGERTGISCNIFRLNWGNLAPNGQMLETTELVLWRKGLSEIKIWSSRENGYEVLLFWLSLFSLFKISAKCTQKQLCTFQGKFYLCVTESYIFIFICFFLLFNYVCGLLKHIRLWT